MHTKVLFKQNTPTSLGAGGKDVYTDLVETKGELKKLSGSRNLSYGEIVEDNRWELKVHYQSTIADNVKVNGKIVIDGAWYTINSMEKVELKNRYYKFILTQQENE